MTLSEKVGLTMMVGFRGPLTKDQTDTLQLIVQSGHSLAELINNILDVTQLEAGRMHFSPSVVDLQSEVESVIELLPSISSSEAGSLDMAMLPLTSSEAPEASCSLPLVMFTVRAETSMRPARSLMPTSREAVEPVLAI